MSESLAGYEAESFLALAGPAGLSAGVVERLNAEVRRYLSRGDRPPTGWVPEAVVDYALKHQLYS